MSEDFYKDADAAWPIPAMSEGKQEACDLSQGTSKCDVCGLDTPHHHEPEVVELERFVRPAFEKTTVPGGMFGRLAKKPDFPYLDGRTERLWQFFVRGWFASKKWFSQSYEGYWNYEAKPCQCCGQIHDGANLAASQENQPQPRDVHSNPCPKCGRTEIHKVCTDIQANQPQTKLLEELAAELHQIACECDNEENGAAISAIADRLATHQPQGKAQPNSGEMGRWSEYRCPHCELALTNEWVDKIRNEDFQRGQQAAICTCCDQGTATHCEKCVDAKYKEAWDGGLAQGKLAMAEKAAQVGDEVNQCLQIIITNAGNIQVGAPMDGDVAKGGREIERAVKRAARAIRSLASAEPPHARPCGHEHPLLNQECPHCRDDYRTQGEAEKEGRT